MGAVPAFAVETPPALVSEAEYLAAEAEASERHEYLAGMVYAMAGASAKHNLICGNVFAALHRHLAGGPCRVFMGDVKLRLHNAIGTFFYYPDLMVTCNPADRASHWREAPRVLIEVVSPSTERVDRREKLFAYREIAALEDYVLVAQDQAEVVVHSRSRAFAPLPADGRLVLPSIEFELPLADIYAGTQDL